MKWDLTLCLAKVGLEKKNCLLPLRSHLAAGPLITGKLQKKMKCFRDAGKLVCVHGNGEQLTTQEVDRAPESTCQA